MYVLFTTPVTTLASALVPSIVRARIRHDWACSALSNLNVSAIMISQARENELTEIRARYQSALVISEHCRVWAMLFVLARSREDNTRVPSGWSPNVEQA